MKNWYAVFCKPQQDAFAETHLQRQGYETFRPLIRLRRKLRQRYQVVIESMFPRYLFIHLERGVQDWSPIRSTFGVSGLVRMGNYTPTVPDSLILSMKSRADADNVIQMQPEDSFQPNQSVRITEGPLAGFEAIYVARNSQDRVIVLLNLIQVSLPVHAISRA